MKPPRSSAYLKWIRLLPCCCCGTRKNVEAAHGPNAGMGRKGSDFDALPLCAACHRTGRLSQHGLGSWERFADVWVLDLEALRRDYRERFERVTASPAASREP